jgi:hypothetical protein
MVHRTPTSDRIKKLLFEAQQLDNAIAALPIQYDKNDIELKDVQKKLEEEKGRILASAAALKPMARVEDTRVFKVKKHVRRNKDLFYWFAAWTVGNKTRNVYLGSCTGMDAETALKKARSLKAKALGLSLIQMEMV